MLTYISGCAGSHKTSSLIKCGMKYSGSHNILFLTKITSVTVEINERLNSIYGIEFVKSNDSGHYIGLYKKKWISVSNFDSFIDKQIQYTCLDNGPLGDEYDLKVTFLSKSLSKLKDLVMKNNEKVSILLIDEIQDFDEERVKFIFKLLTHYKDLKIYIAGDKYQSIFGTSGIHLFREKIKEIDYHRIDLDTCRRCPKNHIYLLHIVFPRLKSYIKSDGTIPNNNPILLEQPTPYKIESMIKDLMKKDDTLTYDDIVVLMTRTNNNLFFDKLKMVLGDTCVHFNTIDAIGNRMNISWSSGQNKIKLMSIHADKGKGHKVVFFIGSPHDYIDENSFYLFYVAMTRSLKYLVIGMEGLPLHFLGSHRNHLSYS